jgi:hypothetical protein
MPQRPLTGRCGARLRDVAAGSPHGNDATVLGRFGVGALFVRLSPKQGGAERASASRRRETSVVFSTALPGTHFASEVPRTWIAFDFDERTRSKLRPPEQGPPFDSTTLRPLSAVL